MNNGILPETGYLRIRRVLTFVPFSRSHLWKEVKEGRFPKPVKLSERVTAWRAEDIRAWIVSSNSQTE